MRMNRQTDSQRKRKTRREERAVARVRQLAAQVSYGPQHGPCPGKPCQLWKEVPPLSAHPSGHCSLKGDAHELSQHVDKGWTG